MSPKYQPPATFVEALAAALADVSEDDPCPRCGGDHDRIDRREPCPDEQVDPWQV